MQMTGLMLTFEDPAYEEAFACEFNSRRRELDQTGLKASIILNCCGMLVPLSNRLWIGAVGYAFKVCLPPLCWAAAHHPGVLCVGKPALLLCLARWAPMFYVRRRAPLIAATLLSHVMVRAWQKAGGCGRSRLPLVR